MSISNISGSANPRPAMSAQNTGNRAQNTSGSANAAGEGGANPNDMLAYLQTKTPGLTLASGNSLSLANDGKTGLLTINPGVLNQMQNDPGKKAYYEQRIKDMEGATNWVNGFVKGMGYTTVFNHVYMDEEGNFSSIALNVKKDEMNEKLRQEAKERLEENVRQAREDGIEERKQAKEKFIEKLESSEDGIVKLSSDEMEGIIAYAANEAKAQIGGANGVVDVKA